MLQKIAIHGVPRSGTTWLGEILNSNEQVIYKYQPLFSYAFKSYLDEQSDAERIAQFFTAIAQTPDTFMDQTEQRACGDLPVFLKSTPTHIVYKEVRYHHILANLLQQDPEVKLIALIRNPLAVMASWLAAPREFRRDLGWVVDEEWRNAPSKNENKPECFYGFEKWKEAAYLFHALAKQYPQRVTVLSYNALLTRPEEETQRLCDFVGLPFTAQMRQFLQSSRAETKDDTYSVFRVRQQDDGWKAALDKSIESAIRADLCGGDLACYLEE